MQTLEEMSHNNLCIFNGGGSLDTWLIDWLIHLLKKNWSLSLSVPRTCASGVSDYIVVLVQK